MADIVVVTETRVDVVTVTGESWVNAIVDVATVTGGSSVNI